MGHYRNYIPKRKIWKNLLSIKVSSFHEELLIFSHDLEIIVLGISGSGHETWPWDMLSPISS